MLRVLRVRGDLYDCVRDLCISTTNRGAHVRINNGLRVLWSIRVISSLLWVHGLLWRSSHHGGGGDGGGRSGHRAINVDGPSSNSAPPDEETRTSTGADEDDYTMTIRFDVVLEEVVSRTYSNCNTSICSSTESTGVVIPISIITIERVRTNSKVLRERTVPIGVGSREP